MRLSQRPRFIIGHEYRPVPPAPPCGECENCKLSAEIGKALEFIDRRMLPPAREASRWLAECRWKRASDPEWREANRTFRKAKHDWMQSRERFLTPDVIELCACEKTHTVEFPDPVIPDLPEVTAIPQRERLDALRALAEAMTIRPLEGQCFRCGKPIDRPPAGPLEVCEGCFGKDSA